MRSDEVPSAESGQVPDSAYVEYQDVLFSVLLGVKMQLGPLIDTSGLHRLLQGAQPPVLADCRFSLADTGEGERQYQAAHIPGAVYLHLDRDMCSARKANGGRHPLPTVESFADTLRRAGLSTGQMLVAYDDSRGAYAARLWWLARYFGHRDVRVLDGGWRAWCESGLPCSAVVPVPDRGSVEALADPSMIAEYDDLIEASRRAKLMLIDSREVARFRGEAEPIDPIAGHIPGAINRPWMEATLDSGRFLEPARQAERWNGLPEPERAVVYCGSGVTACVNLLSLELAGSVGARLYPGSWSDWCSRPGSPIASGE